MRFDGSFKRIGSANVDRVKTLAAKLSDASWRQDWHKDCTDGVHVIFLVHDDELRHNRPDKQPALEVFADAIRPLLAITADHLDSAAEGILLTQQYGAGYFVRARLLRVSPGSGFIAAADASVSEQNSYRVHVPIMTNNQVRFVVANKALRIPEGEIYEVNNLCERRLRNDGESSCVHLVLDYVLDRQPVG